MTGIRVAGESDGLEWGLGWRLEVEVGEECEHDEPVGEDGLRHGDRQHRQSCEADQRAANVETHAEQPGAGAQVLFDCASCQGELRQRVHAKLLQALADLADR